ncbi:MAG: DUF502 domain-containing protein [Gammaproteobacteria bacterium]|jgi:uncharacterized membrane protein
MLKFISKHVFTGLLAILPVALTVYFLYWLAAFAESLLGGIIKLVLPEDMYWPGMGTITGLLVLLLIGVLLHAYTFRRLFSLVEQLLYHMPVVKSIYGAIRDFFNYFSPETREEFEQVVSVSIGDSGMEVIGFVTQALPENMPADLRKDQFLLVYIPLSYMIGGFTVLMPREAVRPLSMNMEEAMRFALTAGITGSDIHSFTKKE